MASLSIYAEYVGLVGGTDVYRIDLSQVNLSSIQAITFHDDNVRSGGTAGASGADLDFVKLSTTYTASASEAASFAGLDAFDFSGSGVVYRPGYLWQWREWDDPLWYSSHLFGTGPGNVYSPTAATLGVRDGAEAASQGTLSLGEGGQVSFLLNSPVPTGYGGSTYPRYLYFGEYRGYGYSGDDHVLVTLSDQRAAPAYSSNVTLYGSPGADSLILGRGVNAHLGSGNDFVSGQLGADTIMTGSGNDRLYGGFQNDKLYGEAGHDRLYGGADNDLLYGGAHNDVMLGEAGYDRLYGGTHNDRLYGDAGHDRLHGNAGKDYLNGGSGNDRLHGGTGYDYLYGGSGKDVFVFDTKPHRSNVDRIYDFNVVYDSFFLENSYFMVGKGSAARPLKLNQDMFVIGSQAADAEDRVIYDKDRGILYYDQDGTGSKAPIKIAILQKGLKMTYHDFFVI